MRKLARNRTVIVGASLLGLLVVLGIAERGLERTAAAQSKAAVQAPRFEVDPLWPKPMPNHWVLGQTIGVWVDTDDHVWIVHRSSATDPPGTWRSRKTRSRNIYTWRMAATRSCTSTIASR